MSEYGYLDNCWASPPVIQVKKSEREKLHARYSDMVMSLSLADFSVIEDIEKLGIVLGFSISKVKNDIDEAISGGE